MVCNGGIGGEIQMVCIGGGAGCVGGGGGGKEGGVGIEIGGEEPFPNCQTVILFYFNALRIADLGSKELKRYTVYMYPVGVSMYCSTVRTGTVPWYCTVHSLLPVRLYVQGVQEFLTSFLCDIFLINFFCF
jgi:hypothetical protein